MLKATIVAVLCLSLCTILILAYLRFIRQRKITRVDKEACLSPCISPAHPEDPSSNDTIETNLMEVSHSSGAELSRNHESPDLEAAAKQHSEIESKLINGSHSSGAKFSRIQNTTAVKQNSLLKPETGESADKRDRVSGGKGGTVKGKRSTKIIFLWYCVSQNSSSTAN